MVSEYFTHSGNMPRLTTIQERFRLQIFPPTTLKKSHNPHSHLTIALQNSLTVNFFDRVNNDGLTKKLGTALRHIQGITRFDLPIATQEKITLRPLRLARPQYLKFSKSARRALSSNILPQKTRNLELRYYMQGNVKVRCNLPEFIAKSGKNKHPSYFQTIA